MACVEYNTWLKAKQDCMAINSSVKGFGYAATGMRGVLGLGLGPDLAVSVGYDPCAIAAQPFCPDPSATCPTGLVKSCIVAAPGRPSPGCTCFAPKPPPVVQQDPQYTPPPVTQQASMTAGFSHWGLLAAVLVGGVVVYKVATRKQSS